MELHCHAILLVTLALVWPTLDAKAVCVGDQLSAHTYSVNLVPREPATKLYSTWSPLLDRIGKQTGLCFTIRISKNFAKFEHAMHEGETDFIYFNPYHQVMTQTSSGYVPLVRDEASRLAGILVTQRDGGIDSIEELEGKTVAFPAPNAYVASLLMRALLTNQGIDIEPKYVISHSNVYRAVALKLADAGGTANNTLASQPEALRSQLRIIYHSPFYITHPFSAHPRVSESDREKIAEAFLSLSEDSEGHRLLAAIQIPHPTRADYERDYKELEALDLDRFVQYTNEIEKN
jgi:phosphonate transport system substrate-binding protein